MPVLGQNDHAADHHGFVIQRIHPRRGDREAVIRYDDIFCIRRVMFVKLLPERDVMLFCHGLDPDVIRSGLLPGFCGANDGQIGHFLYFRDI